MSDTYTAAQIAQLITSETLPPDGARLRFKNFVARGYVVTRQRSESDKRGTLLFSEGDALTAAVLSNLVDLGGLSKEAMQAAASRLHGWTLRDGVNVNDPSTPESAAHWMWNVFRADSSVPPGFTLRISWVRSLKGEVECFAMLAHGEEGDVGEMPEVFRNYVPVADLIFAVDPVMLDLAARTARLKGAH